VEHLLGFVDVLHEGDDATVEFEFVALARALVGDADVQARVQKRQLPQSLGERIEVEFHDLEDGGVWLEGDFGAAQIGDPDLRDLLLGHAPGVLLLVDFSLPLDLETKPLRKRVHAGHADAVEPAGDLIGGILELAACVQLGHHYVDGVHPLNGRVRADRYSAPVVLDGNGIVDVDDELNVGADSGESLVHCVVYHFVNEMMQAVGPRVAHVHPGAFADGFQSLQDRD